MAAAPLVGMVFALGWTPCISPTLGVVVNLGFNEGTAARGGLLGFVYALGLGGRLFAAHAGGVGVQRVDAELAGLLGDDDLRIPAGPEDDPVPAGRPRTASR